MSKVLNVLKLLKLVKTLIKVSLRWIEVINVLLSVLILNFKKWYGVFIFSLRNESDGFYRIRDIIVQKADKVSTVVILKRKDHVCKIKSILNDRSKFQKVYVNHDKILNNLMHMENRAKKSSLVSGNRPGEVLFITHPQA